MTTISVPPLSPFVFTTQIGEAGGPAKQPLNTPEPQKFRGLRGVFKITVTRSNPVPPYFFYFVMKGGTGRYRTDPGRPFFYLRPTAIDNHSQYLEVVFEQNLSYNTLKIKTKETPAVLYLFTFPVSISQWSFPTIQRIGNMANDIEGPVAIKVENYSIDSM